MKIIAETEDSITISKKAFNSLIEDARKLEALECGGVDNWQWYGEALNNYFGDTEDDEGMDDAEVADFVAAYQRNR